MCNDEIVDLTDRDGIRDILQAIVILQKRAVREEERELSCDRDKLDCNNCKPIDCDTRPLILYCNCPAQQWAMPINRDNPDGPTSNIFRVEKVEDNVATFRVLVKNENENDCCAFISTESFFTIRLGCICCIRCLPDTCAKCLI